MAATLLSFVCNVKSQYGMGHIRDIPSPLRWDTKGTLPMGHIRDTVNGTRKGHRSGLFETLSADGTILKYRFPLIG